MPNPPQAPLPPETPRRAGGCLIAAGLMLGTGVGVMMGQGSAGLLIGLAAGIIAAVAMARGDRR